MNRAEIMSKQLEIVEKEFEKYKKRVFDNLPWYKKLWYRLTKRGL